MESKPTKNALEDFLTFNDSETPEKMEEVARKELGETEELKEQCLQEMKALVEGGWNTSFCTDEEFAMTIIVLMNYAAENESSQVTGILILLDTRNPQLANVPHLLRHTSFGKDFLFNSLPMRYCGFHIINQNAVVDYVLRLLRPILPSKIKNRIFLHGNTRDALFQQIPPCIVPENYGGTLGPLNNDHLVDLILDYLQKLKDEQQHFLPNNR